MMKIIVGLGNIAREYKYTRHNAGFIIVDLIAECLKIQWKETKLYSIGYHPIEQLILCKPKTNVNASGLALSHLVKNTHVSLDNLYIIHDEVELKFGNIKIDTGRSAKGHNGIRSIDGAISNNYYRIRIGIGKSEHVLHDHVLGKFLDHELKTIEDIAYIIAAQIDHINDQDKFHDNILQMVKGIPLI